MYRYFSVSCYIPCFYLGNAQTGISLTLGQAEVGTTLQVLCHFLPSQRSDCQNPLFRQVNISHTVTLIFPSQTVWKTVVLFQCEMHISLPWTACKCPCVFMLLHWRLWSPNVFWLSYVHKLLWHNLQSIQLELQNIMYVSMPAILFLLYWVPGKGRFFLPQNFIDSHLKFF